MKCVVTGGCGFIGSHLVDELIRRGFEVVAIDDLSTGSRENLNPKAQFVQGTILDLDLLRQATHQAAWVFHTAAWARVMRSIEDPIGTHQVNVNGWVNILQACRENGVRRIIYSSSSSVYGDQPVHLMNETMPMYPKSPYALHKLIGEQYATLFTHLFNMQVVSLRYFNVYGPRQLTEGAYALVIGKFLKQKAAGLPLTVYGDGEQTRAYTHITDVVRANMLAAEVEFAPGENVILNIGTAEEVSVNEIARQIGGTVEHVLPNPRGDFEERRKAADFGKAREVLGWEPTVTLTEGLAQLLAEVA